LPTCSNLSHPSTTDSFGTSVGVSGNLAVVGAPGQSAQPFFAYAYDGTSWGMGPQPGALSGSATSDGWGQSVAIDGSLLAVGAPGASGGLGHVRVYQYLNGAWNTLLDADPPANNATVQFSGTMARFGSAVAVSGDLVVVGAPAATASAQSFAGAALVYRCPAQ
jgi:hypothetical protein